MSLCKRILIPLTVWTLEFEEEDGPMWEASCNPTSAPNLAIFGHGKTEELAKEDLVTCLKRDFGEEVKWA